MQNPLNHITTTIHTFQKYSRDQRRSTLFHILGWGWVLIVSIVIIRLMWQTFGSEPSWQLGWSRVLERYNPFDIVNIILMIILLLPAIGAFLAKEHFEQ